MSTEKKPQARDTHEKAEAQRLIAVLREIAAQGNQHAETPPRTVEDRRRQFEAHLRYLERRMEHAEEITLEDTREVRLMFMEQWQILHEYIYTAQQRLQEM